MIVNSYNLSRSILALGTSLTLIANSNYTLFGNVILEENYIESYWAARLNLFYIFSDNLIVGKIIALFGLAAVISGFYPRITGLIHAYISWSLMFATDVLDGGDHITSNISLLLLPLCLLDNSKNHWKEYRIAFKKIEISKLFYVLIIIQVFFIYLHAFIGKLNVEEWANGTALFYWSTHNHFGIHDFFRPMVVKLLANSIICQTLTWGVIALQFFFAASILLRQNDKRRWYVLLIGIFFHLNIIIVHGLFSFFFAMSGALILYLIPYEKSFEYKTIRERLKPLLSRSKNHNLAGH